MTKTIEEKTKEAVALYDEITALQQKMSITAARDKVIESFAATIQLVREMSAEIRILRERLEIIPAYKIDGISFRDTIIDSKEEELERLREI